MSPAAVELPRRHGGAARCGPARGGGRARGAGGRQRRRQVHAAGASQRPAAGGGGGPGAHSRRVGYVFQQADDQLFMPTVQDDVAFGPANLGLDEAAVRACVHAALDRVGALHLAARAPWRLSGGEKRAVAIAGVLAMAPEVLVLDEPSSDLDPAARRRLIALLQSLPQTLLTATHDLALARAVCPRVLVLHEGRVHADWRHAGRHLCRRRDAAPLPPGGAGGRYAGGRRAGA